MKRSVPNRLTACLVACLLLAGCQSDESDTASAPSSKPNKAHSTAASRSSTAPDESASRSEGDTAKPQVLAETPEEAVDVWYRALNARDRDLLDAILLRDLGGFNFGPADSTAYEIEEKDVLDTDEELARHEAVERGDVLILTKTHNPETGETYPGDFFVVRKTGEGWKIEGYSTRQYIPEEVE